MAKINYGGQEHEIGTLLFRELRAAAPYIDRAQATKRRIAQDRTTEETSMADMTESVRDMLSVLGIGILKARGEFPYTVAKIEAQADEMEANIGVEEFRNLDGLFLAVLEEAGMRRAAPRPPETAEAGEDLQPPSITSSSSSSQQESAAGTGTE